MSDLTSPETASSCPKCGTPTPLAHHGHRSLCLPCTEAEIGETVAELRERVTNMTLTGRKRKWSVFATGARERGVKADQRKEPRP